MGIVPRIHAKAARACHAAWPSALVRSIPERASSTTSASIAARPSSGGSGWNQLTVGHERTWRRVSDRRAGCLVLAHKQPNGTCKCGSHANYRHAHWQEVGVHDDSSDSPEDLLSHIHARGQVIMKHRRLVLVLVPFFQPSNRPYGRRQRRNASDESRWVVSWQLAFSALRLAAGPGLPSAYTDAEEVNYEKGRCDEKQAERVGGRDQCGDDDTDHHTDAPISWLEQFVKLFQRLLDVRATACSVRFRRLERVFVHRAIVARPTFLEKAWTTTATWDRSELFARSCGSPISGRRCRERQWKRRVQSNGQRLAI